MKRREHRSEIARQLLAVPAFNTTARDDEYGRGWNAAVAAMRTVLEGIATPPEVPATDSKFSEEERSRVFALMAAGDPEERR